MPFPMVFLQSPTPPAPPVKLAEALRTSALVWQFSGPEEVRALLGTPTKEEKVPDGGMELLLCHYPGDLVVAFGRAKDTQGSYGLLGYMIGGKRVQRRPEEPLVLRSAGDLERLNRFTGLQNVDASKADLRGSGDLLRTLPFDTLTRWPKHVPEGFDPRRLLEEGKNPGLGLRALHAQGIDGRGLGLGIIDQPLVKDHAELQGRLDLVAELDVQDVPPQMHGPAVTSLAAGRTCGVAPGAQVHMVAVPMWKASQGNGFYLQALERLLELNRTQKANIRAVSISDGRFASAPQAEAWKALLARAEQEGVLVITCDLAATGLDYGLLRPLGDRDRPEGYVQGTYGGDLLVPGDGRTYASHLGTGVYAHAPQGGMSWAAPWLAGLATLGFQVNPKLSPAQVRTFLVQSATPMPYGRVVNPAAFLNLCQGR